MRAQEAPMKRAGNNHPTATRLDAAARQCQRAPEMVIPGVCPHCGKRVRRDFYGLVCRTCGWTQDAETPTRTY
jgi:hypothetical protein